MFNFAWFKSNKEQEASWNPNTLTMEQPSSPPAPVAQGQIVTEQPVGFLLVCMGWNPANWIVFAGTNADPWWKRWWHLLWNVSTYPSPVGAESKTQLIRLVALVWLASSAVRSAVRGRNSLDVFN